METDAVNGHDSIRENIQNGYEDTLNQWHSCKRNAGHSNLIPIREFSVDHLQFNFKKQDLFDLIKLLGDLTVKVTVNNLSPERQAKKKSTAENCPIIGTGKICEVKKKIPGNNGEEKCPCTTCVTSGYVDSPWVEFTVVTSKKVVYDETEGRHATCIWGYDGADSHWVPLEGVGAVTSDKDWCHVKCVTHNLSLADELENKLTTYKSRRVRLFNEYKNSGVEAKLIAVVSHPHGHYKHVSIKVEQEQQQEPATQDQTAPPVKKNCVLDTCCGSRGAPAYILDKTKNWLSAYC